MTQAHQSTTVSVCMIVKNEEQHLEQALNSARSIADEIILVDTGSTDNTLKIAAQFTDKIYHFEWCDDFSKARNVALKHATQDWILILNGDETLHPSALPLIQSTLKKVSPKEPWLFLFRLLTPNERPQYVRGIFSNHLGIHFKGRVHEFPTLPGGSQGIRSVECSDWVVEHTPSYVSDKYTKDLRALLLDLAELTDPFECAIHSFHLGRTHLKLKNATAAHGAFLQALKHFEHSKAKPTHRLHHNILVPLVRLGLYALDDPEQATIHAEQLTQLFPGFLEGWWYLAYAKFWSGELGLAHRHVLRVLHDLEVAKLPLKTRSRLTLQSQTLLGRLQLLEGHFEQGLSWLDRVYEQTPSQELTYHLARGYALAGQGLLAQDILEHSGDIFAHLAQQEIWSPAEAEQIDQHRKKKPQKAILEQV